MRFYDREREMDALNHILSAQEPALIVMTGRRRVGKTRLVNELLKDHKSLKIMIVPKEETQVASDFSELFANEGFKPNLSSFRNALEYFFSVSKERILFIDEFSNSLEVNPSIPFELQRLWEINRERKKVLILSGSYVSMMDKIFTRQKAPLFNRADLKVVLEPLEPETVWRLLDDLGVHDPQEKIELYCIFGGIPYYYELIERMGRLDPVKSLFFGVGQLNEEGFDVLRQEFGQSYRKYFAIMEAIGNGQVSAGEIAVKLGIRHTTLSKYIQALRSDFRLITRRVPFGENPARSKKGRYEIRDNLLSFWFAHVYGRNRPPSEAELNLFVSKRFELLAEDFLLKWLDRNGERVVRSGRWWGPVHLDDGKYEQREIDLIVETESHMYIAECKWTGNRVGEKELRRLKESARGVRVTKPIRWVLFSKNGFNVSKSKDVYLFDPTQMTEF
ncbi:MAG: ATP-binding protein [Thermoplasmataceae archaeon]